MIDCDVIQADGGTRTAAISGGFVALALALRKLKAERVISEIPLRDYVAAVSLGFVNGELCLDLDYALDSRAEVDMNLVMTGGGDMVEIQGTAEGKTFSPKELERMVAFGWNGIASIIAAQREVLSG